MTLDLLGEHSPIPFYGEPQVRRIWVERDGYIEYKIWYIFTWHIQGTARHKIVDFLRKEETRYNGSYFTAEERQLASHNYSRERSFDHIIPPRLCAINASTLATMGTCIVHSNDIVYGDSVGGLHPMQKEDVGLEIRERVSTNDRILFSPGVLARLGFHYSESEEYSYLFQLAAKNLRKTGSIFYKAIGGHLKYDNAFEKLMQYFQIEVKRKGRGEDFRDIAFWLPGNKLDEFAYLFEKETSPRSTSNLFLSPLKSMSQEIYEELGPIQTDDGISLLTISDIVNDFISPR